LKNVGQFGLRGNTAACFFAVVICGDSFCRRMTPFLVAAAIAAMRES